MKKNTLSTALLAGLVGTVGMVGISNAVNINPDGIGQALIYPYYTVRDGQLSLMSVVNTADVVKAVKVRYIEGKASQEVLDFNLYLSPYDVWTAAIVDNGTGGSLVVADRSCTAPDIVRDFGGTVDFRNFQYTGDAADDDSMDRTREGYVEVIEMAVLTGAGATAATHVGGEPADCSLFTTDWINSVYDTADDIPVADGGSIYGGMSIIDPVVGSDASYNAVAFASFNTVDNNHTEPGDLFPSLANAIPSSIVFDNGLAVTSAWTAGEDAVSATIMHDAIMNEWTTESSGGITAYTDWVVTFPTKRFYVADDGLSVADPFTQVLTPAGACEPISISLYDREENEPGTPTGTIDFSPPQPTTPVEGPALCWETSVITFNGSNALSSNLAENIDTASVPGPNGWMKVTFDDPLTAGADNTMVDDNVVPQTYTGLPTIGFMVQEFVDADPAATANYTGLFPHRGTRSIL